MKHLKSIWVWLDGKKSQIGAGAALTVGFLINKQVLDEMTGNYLLAMVGLWTMGATYHRVKKKISAKKDQA